MCSCPPRPESSSSSRVAASQLHANALVGPCFLVFETIVFGPPSFCAFCAHSSSCLFFTDILFRRELRTAHKLTLTTFHPIHALRSFQSPIRHLTYSLPLRSPPLSAPPTSPCLHPYGVVAVILHTSQRPAPRRPANPCHVNRT